MIKRTNKNYKICQADKKRKHEYILDERAVLSNKIDLVRNCIPTV